MIAEDGVRGLTSNPTIFQKAIAASDAYDDIILNASPSESDASVLERIMVRDLRAACDELRPVYERTNGADGYASIEVDPILAHDTQGQITQAKRLWNAVGRPNLMVKIPATRAGIPAIEQSLADGSNVNVTLLFSVARYREVVDAFLRALERRVDAGQPVHRVASVASFFVSRVDTKLDPLLDVLPNSLRGAAGSLRGEIGIANAKLAYEEWERIFDSGRWKALVLEGARPQRLLWGSTSPKDPAYSDTYYVEELIGRDTVDTMTLDGFRAYLDHGEPEQRLDKDRELAHEQMTELTHLQIDLANITDELEDEGVRKFVDSYRGSLKAISEKRRI